MSTITGKFIYDFDKRSLMFEFDEESRRYISETRPNSIQIEPQVDKACGVWRGYDGQIIPSIPAVCLTFSPKSKHNGLLVDVVVDEPVNHWQRCF